MSHKFIVVDLGNRTLGITFQREFEIPEEGLFINKRHVRTGEMRLSAPAGEDKLRATYCEIHRLKEAPKPAPFEGVEWVSDGIMARTRARADSRDSFSREKGRKIALRRALVQYGLTRGDRVLVWHAYHNRPRPRVVKVELVEEIINLLEAPRLLPEGVVEADFHAGEV